MGEVLNWWGGFYLSFVMVFTWSQVEHLKSPSSVSVKSWISSSSCSELLSSYNAITLHTIEKANLNSRTSVIFISSAILQSTCSWGEVIEIVCFVVSIVVVLLLICCNVYLINLIHKFFSVFFRSAFVYRGLRVVALLSYVCQYWERGGGKRKAYPL